MILRIEGMLFKEQMKEFVIPGLGGKKRLRRDMIPLFTYIKECPREDVRKYLPFPQKQRLEIMGVSCSYLDFI